MSVAFSYKSKIQNPTISADVFSSELGFPLVHAGIARVQSHKPYATQQKKRNKFTRN